MVVTAKVVDEAVIGPPAFLAVAGAPRVSSQRFDHLVGDAGRRLAGQVGHPLVDIDVPELVGHQLLHDLGPHSVLDTAAAPGGAALTAGFVQELLGGAAPSPAWAGLPAALPARTGARRRHAVAVLCRAVGMAGAAPGDRRPIGHG